MSLVINTNIYSLEAQNNLSGSQAALNSAVEDLSSGLRINSAADDAAGFAIATRLSAQINGANQAVDNSNNGISLAQTAEGSLSSITNDLQRIRQLAVEAANGTNSASDQQALNTESQQLLSEINRQASAATFNGVNLFDGSNSSLLFQVGANTTGSNLISVFGFTNLTETNSPATGGSAATLGVVQQATAASTTAAASLISTASLAATTTGVLTINGIDIGPLEAASSTSQRANDVVSAINGISAQDGGVAAYLNANGEIALTESGTASLTVGGSDAAAGAVTGVNVGTAAIAATATGNYSTIDLTSQVNARTAINQVDAALTTINTISATLGAVQNRFTSVVSSLTSTAQNLTQARSTIQDADFAAETADYTQASILQQSGTAVLAQANSIPKNVLTLLQNL
jgi:flagellin